MSNLEQRQGMLDIFSLGADHDMSEWGTGGIGIALLRRYCSDEPWATAAQLSDEVHLSTAQVRRRLNQLVEGGKVLRRDEGTSDVYTPVDEHAEASVKFLEELIVAKCNAP